MNAIEWMTSKATTEQTPFENFDGQIVSTITRTFKGTLPPRMVREIKSLATNRRDGQCETSYSHQNGNDSWGCSIGNRKSTQNHVRFTATEYVFK